MEAVLGLNISHDASAALLAPDGQILYAVEEERLSRVKGHFGLPILALEWIMESAAITEPLPVVIGSTAHLTEGLADTLIANEMGSPSGKRGRLQEAFPGFRSDSGALPARVRVERAISAVFERSDRPSPKAYEWERHHDAHLGCALGLAQGQQTLLISLDSSGDHESGAVALHSGSGQFSTLARFPDTESLGALYSAVTSRYNFVPNRHEGKITGLAAYGHWTSSASLLAKFVQVDAGVPRIGYVRGFRQVLERLLRRSGRPRRQAISMMDIADMAEAGSCHYEDLAFAIQSVLEQAVLEIAEYWSTRTRTRRLALAGGVFANVKVNQKLADAPFTDEVLVFPAMGDGGLSVGGAWSHLAKLGQLGTASLFNDVFLGPADEDTGGEYLISRNPTIQSQSLSLEAIVRSAVDDLVDGKVVALHQGRLEFGPRALGNRSILLDPRTPGIVDEVNRRLHRTEFMPFAPVVSEDRFRDYFRTANGTLQPFWFMTMTCDVRKDVRNLIPAVTHVDGTARPQIVSEQTNPLVHRVIKEFEARTGVGCLVNTSFNVHEEPINCSLDDSLRALERGAIDVLYTDAARIVRT